MHPLLVLVARPNELDFTRVAFVAGRRVGKAVDRNRAKRLMREAARSIYPRFDPGWDIVLVARHRILGVKEPRVEASLASLARRAGLAGSESGAAAPAAEEKDEG